MKAIFGYVSRSDAPISPAVMETMHTIMRSFGPLEYEFSENIGIALGWSLNSNASMAANCRRQLYNPTSGQVTFIAAGRIDNTSELGKLLNIPESERQFLPAQELMRQAYMRWGEDCSTRIYGNWAYAAWHSDERKLILSRDHHGHTSLYYYVDKNIFAFASSRKALLALKLAPIELDELYLAQYLLSCGSYQGEQTLHSNIRRLPPAHCLTVSRNNFNVHRYWRLEDTPEIHLSRKEDYVEALQHVFDEAVRCRLSSDGQNAITLSGGLDSSSVAVTAASLLKDRSQRLMAFTSVPFFDSSRYLKSRFGNELPFAQASAKFAGNIDLYPLASMEITPIMGVRRALELNCDLCHGAANMYWFLDIMQSARAHGCSVLLTGGQGNGSISWEGDIFSQPLSFLWSHLSLRRIVRILKNRIKQGIKLALPMELLAAIQKRRIDQLQWHRRSAIHPEFAKRLKVFERIFLAPSELPPRTARDIRCKYIMPGKYIGAAYESELATAHGLDICDPTVDARVLEFMFSVPEHIFMDPKTGIDRWLIREAMKERLPDMVRLNRNRGRQASDLVPRLRASAGEVESTLDELAQGPAAEYVDIDHMRLVWHMIQTEDTNEAFIKSSNLLIRGIMAGLFVNQFYE